MSPDPSNGIEDNFEELYEQAPCAYLSIRPDGSIIRANQTFLDWAGRDRPALEAGFRFQDVLTIGTRIYYETHYAPLLQMQPAVHEIALDIRGPGGINRSVVASARRLQHADGRIVGYRIALFESTDRRRYERELVIARKQAEDAAEALASADRKKDEFIALLAHELRNPLAPIRSAVEILRAAGGNDVIERTTGMMQRQVALMTRLIEDLLDASRIGQDKMSVRRVPVELASVVHHAVEVSEPFLRDAGVVFSLVLPRAPVYVSGDAARLAQAIGNVLNNAAKFTPRGGSVQLTLETVYHDALIYVRDSGIGIEEAQRAHVFDLFMQAAPSSRRPDGLGIGLALAKSFVERHDGRITVQSEGRDRGSEFVIHLPLLQDAPASVTHAFSARVPEPAVAPKRVLVVDDNRDSAQMMSALLELFGHEVQMAFDGLEAVGAAARFDPDIVLLDIGLPELNGYEVATRIRARPGNQPALVALTGWGQDEDRRRSAAAGFDAHLVKPIDHEVLRTLISDLASRRQSP